MTSFLGTNRVDAASRWVRWLSLGQGLYFAVAGVWPLVSMGTFEAVTGPKTDDWLVKTIGVLVAVIGSTLIAGGWRGRITPELWWLAVGSAAGLAAVDVNYAVNRVISPIYLLDAAVEAVLIIAWIARGRTTAGPPS